MAEWITLRSNTFNYVWLISELKFEKKKKTQLLLYRIPLYKHHYLFS